MAGRKKYEYWLTNDGLLLLQSWARDGLIEDEIAAKMGVSRKTLLFWKKQFEPIGNALKKGKEIVDYAVENALFRKAMDGDTTAMIYWLKNRKPKQWRERAQNDDTGDEAQTIRIILDRDKCAP